MGNRIPATVANQIAGDESVFLSELIDDDDDDDESIYCVNIPYRLQVVCGIACHYNNKH